VIDQQTARTMTTMLRGVTQHGTGAAAAQLNHPVGGKTGTTSDYTDAWFLGFSPSVTCGVWVGFDSRESLGEKETGAKAALPIWMTFMRAAIQGKPDELFPGDDESDLMLKAQATPPVPSPQATKPTAALQAIGASKPASGKESSVGVTAPSKPAVRPANLPTAATKPVARLTEATDVAPPPKARLAAQPLVAAPQRSVNAIPASQR